MFGTEFTYAPGWMIPALLPALLLAWLMYRNTRDRLSPALYYGLMGIRACVIWILLVFLLEPIIKSTEKIKNLPVVVYLQDASESMMATADSLRIKNKLPGYYSDFAGQLPEDDAELQSFIFGQGIQGNFHTDSIRYDRAATNISATLKEVSERFTGRHLAAVVLLSDGIYTEGENPVYMLDRLGVPVFTVMAGDTLPRKDAAVGDIQVNEITYVGSEVPVRVSVRTTGYPEAELELRLMHKGKVLESQKIQTRQNDPEKEIFFTIKPQEAGQQMYEFQINQLKDEVNLKNNSARFFLRVLENRMKIAVFAGGPHPDLGALKRALSRFDEYQSESFQKKTKTSFYLNPDKSTLAEYDLFILHNFPSGPQDKEWINIILDQIEKRNTPLLFIAGSGTDLKTEERLFKYLGIVPATLSDQNSESLVYTDETYHTHSSWTFNSKWDEWLSHAPPLIRNNSDWQPKSNTRVFGKAIIKSVRLQFPVFGFQEQLGRKNMVLIGENIWRWRSHSYLETQSFDNFDIWIGNCIQWLTTREDKRKFKVTPAKNFFTGNDRILLRGEVYDDTYQPVSGAEIKLTLTDEAQKEQIFYLSENADRQYGLELFGLGIGNYSYKAETTLPGQNIMRDQGQFSVGRSAAEFLKLTADAGLMEQLARRSGGERIQMEDLPALAEKLKKLDTMKTIVDYRISALDLNRLFWPLMIILALLSVEWIVRKWSGLA